MFAHHGSLSLLALVAVCASIVLAPEIHANGQQDRYWLWVLQRGTAYNNESLPSLDACRREKIKSFFRDDPRVVCSTVSPFSRGPFHLYAYSPRRNRLERVPGSAEFSSLDACDDTALPLLKKGSVLSCGPASFVDE